MNVCHDWTQNSSLLRNSIEFVTIFNRSCDANLIKLFVSRRYGAIITFVVPIGHGIDKLPGNWMDGWVLFLNMKKDIITG